MVHSFRNMILDAVNEISLEDVEHAIAEMKSAGVRSYLGKYYFIWVSSSNPEECSELFKSNETIVIMHDGSYWYRGKQLSEKELAAL